MKLQAVLRGATWVKAVSHNTQSYRLPKQHNTQIYYIHIYIL